MAPLLLLLVGLQAPDAVEVRSTLTQEEIHAGETTTLRVDVETDGPAARIERITRLPPGAELVSTRDYDQRQFSLPGGVRRFITREFVLRARSPGSYRIPSIEVIVDGERFATRSHLLVVTAAPARARGENESVAEDGVILRTWIGADTVFVGEQVNLEAEAMFSREARVRLRRAPQYEPPSPSGFWIQDLPDRRSGASRVVGNEVYEVQSFRRALFPLTEGQYEIPPARLEYEMRRGLLYAPETHTLESDPIPLVVRSVPAEGQPPEFTGAVGEYTVRGWLEPAEVPAGEAAVLTIEVEGRGNVKALPPPDLPELEGLEFFPPSEDSETEVAGGIVRGSKQFSWVIIPREAGAIAIPPIRYPYFNPAVGAYETAEVGEMTLRVTPGGADAVGATADMTLRYLKTRPEPGSLGWVGSTWFGLANLLPLLALALALLVARGAGRSAASIRALRRQRKSAIRDLERRVGDDDAAFFSDLEDLARGWTARRAGVDPRAVQRPGALAERGVAPETASTLNGLLSDLARARYAPTPPGVGERQRLVDAVAAVLERVDREARPPHQAEAGSARAAGTAGSIALALLLAGAAAPAPAAAQSGEDAFAQGIAAFNDGRTDAAVDAFADWVRRHPEDPAGWYNLGNSYHEAGQIGPAIWAWLHVPALAPRDRDVRHNLRVAGVPPELVARVSPALPFRPRELMLAASVLWALAAAAGSVWLLRRTRGAGVAGVVALALALAAAAGWAEASRAPATYVVLERTMLRAGPTLRGDPLTELEPGVGLLPIAGHEDWLRARTLGGREGWVERGAVGSI